MSELTIQQEQLVIENIGLVHYIANRYFCTNMDYADLVQEGTIGLIKASKTFDINRGCQFTTLASICIKGSITNLFRKKRIQALPLNAPSGDGPEMEYINLVDGDINPSTDVHIKMDLQKALLSLDELERFVIEHSFGIGTGECLSQSQIAKMCNFSQVHISRLRKRALKKLRIELEGGGLL